MSRTIPFCILISALTLISSCNDEQIQNPDIEKTRGQEVSFNVSAEPYTTAKSRTYYGDKLTSGTTETYPIFWASKDNIVVGSPMGLADRDTAVYRIVVPTIVGDTVYPGASYAKDIVLNTDFCKAGIQWGENTGLGSFYAIYPYCAETLRRPENLPSIPRYYNSINTKDAAHSDSVTATARVESVQRIWAPYGTNPKTIVTGSGTSREEYQWLNMYGSNHALVMWAQTDGVEQGESVNLRFKPLSTCLMMTFSCGKATGTSGTYFPATIEKITISSGATGPYIAGNMTIDFPDAYTKGVKATGDNKQYYNGGDPKCSLVDGTGSRTIEIIPWIRSNDMASGSHPTLKPGTKMQVCAFLLPTDDITSMSGWTISVEVSGRTYSRTLTTGDLAIKKGQIHEMEFPAFNVTSEWDYNPATWMADISDNAYLSQITFPGSWYSYCQNNPTSGGYGGQSQRYDYQNIDLATQLTKGVRAFDLTTRSSTGERHNSTALPVDVVITGTGTTGTSTEGTGATYYQQGTSVYEAIKTIATHFANTSEVAAVVLSYASEGYGGHRPIDYQYWMHGLDSICNKLIKEGYAIYTDKIDENTTLGQVRGKVILKINLDEEICNNWNKSAYAGWHYPMEGGGIPALISFAPLRWVTDFSAYNPDKQTIETNPANFTFTSLTSKLMWKTWDTYWNNMVINGAAGIRPDLFAWNFSCTNQTYAAATSTNVAKRVRSRADGDSEEEEVDKGEVVNDMPNLALRKTALQTLRKEAIDVYNEGYFNEWFLFGCGGVYAQQLDNENILLETRNSEILRFTQDMNPWLNAEIDSLFSRNSPCPLGIVFLNQIGNPTYLGDRILTNLIKMNNAFYLQEKPETSPSQPSQQVRAMIPSKRKKTSTDSNGWTITQR